MRIRRTDKKIKFYQGKGYHLYEVERGDGKPYEEVLDFCKRLQERYGEIEEVYYRVVSHPVYDTIEVYVKYVGGDRE